ncbi:MAG: two pore domain potassium channel family protein [Burkholderiales bacterium]|nr:two pore domain potassium channel family protein [Burkholderiales bacterium]
MDSRELRRRFFSGLAGELRVVWPILSILLGAIASMGAGVALLERWPLLDGVYFAFVTGLTVGYGDLVPRRTVSRVLAIAIAITGVLLIALLAAIAVRAMESMGSSRPGD